MATSLMKAIFAHGREYLRLTEIDSEPSASCKLGGSTALLGICSSDLH